MEFFSPRNKQGGEPAYPANGDRNCLGVAEASAGERNDELVQEEVRPWPQADSQDWDCGAGQEADDRTLALFGNGRHPGGSGAEGPIDLRRR